MPDSKLGYSVDDRKPTQITLPVILGLLLGGVAGGGAYLAYSMSAGPAALVAFGVGTTSAALTTGFPRAARALLAAVGVIAFGSSWAVHLSEGMTAPQSSQAAGGPSFSAGPTQLTVGDASALASSPPATPAQEPTARAQGPLTRTSPRPIPKPTAEKTTTTTTTPLNRISPPPETDYPQPALYLTDVRCIRSQDSVQVFADFSQFGEVRGVITYTIDGSWSTTQFYEQTTPAQRNFQVTGINPPAPVQCEVSLQASWPTYTQSTLVTSN